MHTMHPDRAQPRPVVPLSREPLPDAELVARALGGDRWAEQAIFERHAGYLEGVCLRLLRDRDEVRDALQDTFVDVLEQLPNLRAPERLRHWMTSIAVNKVHRRFRRRKLLRRLGLARAADGEVESLPARAELPQELRSELARLDRCLGELDAEVRACWVLRHVEGYRLEEVAELCGCSLASVKRRIGRADAHLQQVVRFAEVAP